MKCLLLFSVLLALISRPAFAYEEINTCSNGRDANVFTRQAASIAADKKAKLNIFTSYSNSPTRPNKDFEKMWMYRDWVLGQLNSGTLLRDQISDEIEETNNRYSDSNWVLQKEKDGRPCRQLIFTKRDIQPLGFVWTSPSELLISFNVLLTNVETRRDEGTLYGYRFNMKISIEQNYTNHNYPVVTSATILEYPQFISKDYGSYPEEN